MEVCKNCGSFEKREETTSEIADRLNKSFEAYHTSRSGMAQSYWNQLLIDLHLT